MRGTWIVGALGALSSIVMAQDNEDPNNTPANWAEYNVVTNADLEALAGCAQTCTAHETTYYTFRATVRFNLVQHGQELADTICFTKDDAIQWSTIVSTTTSVSVSTETATVTVVMTPEAEPEAEADVMKLMATTYIPTYDLAVRAQSFYQLSICFLTSSS